MRKILVIVPQSFEIVLNYDMCVSLRNSSLASGRGDRLRLDYRDDILINDYLIHNICI